MIVCDNHPMAKKGRRATHEERFRAVQLLEKGYPADEVAEILEVGRSSVLEWQKKYRSGGLNALLTKFASGRPTSLSDQQMMTLYSLIVGNDPRQYSFGVALWTRQLIGDLIHQKFDVRLSMPTVGRILKKLGMSPQRPLYRAYQQDPEKIRIWKQETFPAIKAAAAKAGGTIFFADEASIRTDHHAGTTWAPIGRTPVVTATGQRASVNMVSAVSARGDIHFDVFEDRMNSILFIEFLIKLVHDCPTPVFLILDGSSVHTATAVKEYVASTKGLLNLFFLPPYSPELNPDEWVWKNVKNDKVARTVAMNKNHLREIVHDALRRLQETSKTVRGFFADPKLAYISANS